MYLLYYDQSREAAGVFDKKSSAMAVAQHLSRKDATTVIGIYTKGGTDYLCFKYTKGAHTFDGGCCSNPTIFPAVL
ncbi:MAG: hypothetical protein AB7I36_15320 [Rhodospirillaceae bacterium]